MEAARLFSAFFSGETAFFPQNAPFPRGTQPRMAGLVFSRHGCRLKTPRSSPISFAHSVRKIRLTAQEAEKSRSASTPTKSFPLPFLRLLPLQHHRQNMRDRFRRVHDLFYRVGLGADLDQKAFFPKVHIVAHTL